MSIEGRIAVDVSFADSATSSGVQSLKKISLVDTTAYTTGKVAIVTGTVSTAFVFIETSPTSFRDASGQFVSFTQLSRVAFNASPGASVATSGLAIVLRSLNNEPAVCSWGISSGPLVGATAGTASYTLVLYGT